MKNTLNYFLAVLTLLFLWQFSVMHYHIPDYLLPSPLQIFFTLYQQQDVLFHQGLITLLEISLGFILGISLGCLAAFSINFFKLLRFWFWPLLIISQVIPVFAIAPLLVIWLGYGLASKIAAASLMTFFPIASALLDGLKNTNTAWLDLAKTMNASKWRIFWYIRLPSALPSLASGIRIAAVAAPMGALVGEWVGSSRGLGYLMLNANARMQIDTMFAALMVMITLALALYFCIDKLLNSYIPFTWVEKK